MQYQRSDWHLMRDNSVKGFRILNPFKSFSLFGWFFFSICTLSVNVKLNMYHIPEWDIKSTDYSAQTLRKTVAGFI